jgi:chemotaxis protein methyltransferase CheR
MTEGIALDRLAAMLTERTGIDFNRKSHRHVLRQCVERRVAAIRSPSIDFYVLGIRGPDHPEAQWLINALTVGHTWFYRDGAQMELIREILRESPERGRQLYVWVPGCATGEDAYTISMLAHSVKREAHVVATDINTVFLEKAARGVYDTWVLRELPAQLKPYFVARSDQKWEAVDEIKRAVRFRPHSLVEAPLDPPHRDGWDLILCRNVLIYFSMELARTIVLKLARALGSGGRLFLGASEVIHSLPDDLCLEEGRGRIMLRKKPAPKPQLVSLGREVSRISRAPEISALADSRSSMPAITSHDIALHRAADLMLRGDHHGAITKYLEILEADAASPEPRMLLGIAYHLNGDAEAAITALRAALFLDGTLWAAAFYLALTYEKLGRGPEAQREYRRVLETSARAKPLRGSAAHDDLERWKHDVVELAKKRAK